MPQALPQAQAAYRLARLACQTQNQPEKGSMSARCLPVVVVSLGLLHPHPGLCVMGDPRPEAKVCSGGPRAREKPGTSP